MMRFTNTWLIRTCSPGTSANAAVYMVPSDVFEYGRPLRTDTFALPTVIFPSFYAASSLSNIMAIIETLKFTTAYEQLSSLFTLNGTKLSREKNARHHSGPSRLCGFTTFSSPKPFIC